MVFGIVAFGSLGVSASYIAIFLVKKVRRK